MTKNCYETMNRKAERRSTNLVTLRVGGNKEVQWIRIVEIDTRAECEFHCKVSQRVAGEEL